MQNVTLLPAPSKGSERGTSERRVRGTSRFEAVVGCLRRLHRRARPAGARSPRTSSGCLLPPIDAGVRSGGGRREMQSSSNSQDHCEQSKTQNHDNSALTNVGHRARMCSSQRARDVRVRRGRCWPLSRHSSPSSINILYRNAVIHASSRLTLRPRGAVTSPRGNLGRPCGAPP